MHDETHPSQISSVVSEVTAVSLLLVDLIRAIRFARCNPEFRDLRKPVPEVASPPPHAAAGSQYRDLLHTRLASTS